MGYESEIHMQLQKWLGSFCSLKLLSISTYKRALAVCTGPMVRLLDSHVHALWP